MIFIICFIYWIISAIVGLSFVSEKDSPEVGVMVGFISVFLGWLILPIVCLFQIFELLKKIL